jgi:hypothetical protein
MNDASDKPASGEERKSLGRAVKDGLIRYSSVSQIVAFDPNQPGGCPSRWAWKYMFGKTEPKTEALERGVYFAKCLENYLKTGYDALPNELRVAKHLFPKPGPDLEVERPMAANQDGALAARLRYLEAKRRGDAEAMRAEEEALWRAAGLVASAVPLIGAADYRHERGQYTDEDGVLRDESPTMTVGETGDLKTTSLIHPHTVSRGKNAGKVLPGYAKTTEQVLAHPQMVGYGVYHIRKNPSLTHVRLSHVYAQTRGGFVAAKRTGLLTVDDVLRRWKGVEKTVSEMEQVAAETDIERIPRNLSSCYAYNKPCPHWQYCDRPETTIYDLFGVSQPEGATVENLFDELSKDRVVQPPLGADTLSRESKIAAEEERLRREDAAINPATTPPPPIPQPPAESVVTETLVQMPVTACDMGRHYHVTAPGDESPKSMRFVGPARLPNGETFYIFVDDEGIRVRLGAADYVLESAVCEDVSIAPPDAPAYTFASSADLIPKELADKIDYPELRERVALHGEVHAAAQEAARGASSGAEEKTSGRCPAGNSTIKTTPQMTATKKATCPRCGKTDVRVKLSEDYTTATLSGHLMPKAEEKARATASAAPAAPAPVPVHISQAAAPPPLDIFERVYANVPPPSPQQIPAIPAIPALPVAPPPPPLPVAVAAPAANASLADLAANLRRAAALVEAARALEGFPSEQAEQCKKAAVILAACIGGLL